MDKDHLFQFLTTQPASVLIEALSTAYDHMNRDQRKTVFGAYLQALPPPIVDGEDLLDDIEEFQRDSLAGQYYAPFDVNSKNYMHVPEETEDWFEQLGELLVASERLSQQGEHTRATICFGILYNLIGKMESGEEIVFGDEIGGWMIPGDGKKFIAAYMISLAAIAGPEEFAAAVAPLVKRDSYQSFSDQVYSSALQVANPAQKALLDAEIQRLKVRGHS